MRRRVTFSRNLTLSLSRTCRCYCKYCAFATHTAHLHSPEEVLAILDGAARRQVKELLVLTGERPEVNPEVRARLREFGHEDFTAYVVWACERALERGLLPHTNLGVLDRTDLARLREVTASQGLMLESVAERLMQTVHAGSPTKHPARRLETIRAAGELRIPFTTGILVGIGETEQERLESLEALAAAHAEFGHIQEVILQNFVPHQRYYGREPAQIADEAARAYWRTGVADEAARSCRFRQWAGERVEIGDMKRLISETRAADARRGHTGAAQPVGLLGGAGGRRRDRSRRPERERRPHLARASLPLAPPGAQAAARDGYALTERLCVYPQLHRPRLDRPGRAGHDQAELLELHPPPGLGPRRAPIADSPRAGRPVRSRRAATGPR